MPTTAPVVNANAVVSFESQPSVGAASPRPVAVVARYQSGPLARFGPAGLRWIWADDPDRFDAAHGLVYGPEPLTLVKVIVNETDEGVLATLAAQCNGFADVWFNDVPVVVDNRPEGAPVTIRRGRNVILAQASNCELGWGAGGFACALWGRGDVSGPPIVVSDGSWGWQPSS